MAVEFAGKGRPLSQQGIDSGTARLAVGAAEIWAVLTVETTGCGFLPDRRPKILFERHIFHNETNGKFDATAPDLSDRTAGDMARAALTSTTAWRARPRSIGAPRCAARRGVSAR